MGLVTSACSGGPQGITRSQRTPGGRGRGWTQPLELGAGGKQALSPATHSGQGTVRGPRV